MVKRPRKNAVLALTFAVLDRSRGLELGRMDELGDSAMNRRIAKALGLAITPYFAREQSPQGEHHLLLDGVRGSFGISHSPTLDLGVDPSNWAWSAGVLHHIIIADDIALILRWDQASGEMHVPASAITEHLPRFYDRIAKAQTTTNKTIEIHAIDCFRRLRSNFTPNEQGAALSVFLLILGAMVQSSEANIFDGSPDVANQFGVDPNASVFLKRLSPEFVRHFISGFKQPALSGGLSVETIPSLMVRHAGAMVFQEAHFHLVQRGIPDIFGVQSPAAVSINTASGVHFTPPGLARAIVEQALDAFGNLPPQITILDPACGSGSILHEALRTLRDRGYTGNVSVIGFDVSAYAVEMTRFTLAALKYDWPEFHLNINIERRDSLSAQPWPTADFILMNPPFVSLRDLSSHEKQAVSNILGRYARGRPDLSMTFVERGLQVLANNGVLGTLLPAGVLSMTYAQEWRRHLLDSASISFLAVFGELGLFRLATVETGCAILRKAPDDAHGTYRSLWVGERKNATPEALRFLRRATDERISVSEMNSTWALDEVSAGKLRRSPTWRPRPLALRRDIEKIESSTSTTVNDFFDVRQGAIPAPRAAFIINEQTWKGLDTEQRWFRRVAENANIRAGQILKGSYIFYPRSEGLPHIENEQSLIENLPVFSVHLMGYKPTLERRRGKHDRWWELGEDRKWLRVPSKKIVSSYFGQAGSFAFDSQGDRIVVQGYGWLPRWKIPHRLGIDMDDICNAYVAIFNSLFFVELLSEVCPTVGGGQLNLSKRYSEKVRLPDLLERIQTSSGVDVAVRDLAFIGERIAVDGLAVAPRARAEELVRLLYGL